MNQTLFQYRIIAAFTAVFLCFFCTASSLNAYHHHPIHATITTIDYNAKTKSLEVSCKIFADDLEEAVKRETGTQAFIGAGTKEVKNLNALLEQYLAKHLRLQADGKPLQTRTFVGKELEGEAVWCYIEIPNVQGVKRLTVEQTVLTELYDDQTNLVNASIGGVRRSTLLRKNKTADVLEF